MKCSTHGFKAWEPHLTGLNAERVAAQELFGMTTPDLPTRLAKKWCAYCYGNTPRVPDPDHHYHGAIAAAVREALEEAQNATCSLCAKGFLLEGTDHIPTQALGMIPVTPCRAAAITALNAG